MSRFPPGLCLQGMLRYYVIIFVQLITHINCARWVDYPPNHIDMKSTSSFSTPEPTLPQTGIKLFFFFPKGPNSKYFWIFKPSSLCYNYSTLPLQLESGHRQYGNEWVQPCSNKIMFTKTGEKLLLIPQAPDLDCSPWSPASH